MTNKKAIYSIRKHMAHHGISHEFGHHYDLCTALEMAIDALEKQSKSKNKINIDQGIECEFKVHGYTMDGDDVIGINVDKGFTICMDDGSGNHIPFNKEFIEELIAKKGE